MIKYKSMSHTRMTTSIDAALLQAADAAADALGESRSRLVADAIRHYLERLDSERMVRELNEVYGGPDAVDAGVADLRRRTVARSVEPW